MAQVELSFVGGVAQCQGVDASGCRPAPYPAHLVERQRRGIAERLMRKLIAAAAANGVAGLADITLYDNRAMLALVRKLGFTARRDPSDPYLIGLSLRLAH